MAAGVLFRSKLVGRLAAPLYNNILLPLYLILGSSFSICQGQAQGYELTIRPTAQVTNKSAKAW